MNQTAVSYATALYDLKVSEKEVGEISRLFSENPALSAALMSPTVSLFEKHRVIDRIFTGIFQNFFKQMCTNGDAGCLPELFFAFENCFCKRNGILRANLRCAFSPDETQMEQFARTIRSRYGEREIRWNVSVDPSLIGGFVLQVGDLESDWSVKGRLAHLKTIMMN